MKQGLPFHWYCIALLLCCNLILGSIVFFSFKGTAERKQNIYDDSGHYVRDAVNNEFTNSTMVNLLSKHVLPLSLRHSQGYVLPYLIYEQQTSSARNLWGVQFWANTVGMKVVEPFFMNHQLSFEPVVIGMSNPLRFSDLYDIDYWNKQSTIRNCSELVSWNNFLSNAPRRVILVLVRGFKSKSQHSANAGTVNIISNPDVIVGRRSCGNSNDVDFPKNALMYFKKNGFKFIREVCVMFNATTPMTVEEYSYHILGNHRSNTVTIIYSFWQGIRENRINLKGVKLVNENTVEIGLLPSNKIVKQSETYLQNLNNNSGNNIELVGKHFGVMVRIEKVYRSLVIYKKANYDMFIDYMLECASDLKHLNLFSVHKDWGRTLAIDLGRLGSMGFNKQLRQKTDEGEKRLYKAYFSSVFGDEGWTMKEFENSFKKYIGIDNPVYIAQVQRTIAARSDCLVLVGGGSTFQTVAISFYKYFHPDVKKQCIMKLCYYGENLDFNSFVQRKTAHHHHQ